MEHPEKKNYSDINSKTISEKRSRKQFAVKNREFDSDTFTFNAFFGDNIYTINGKEFLKDQKLLFKTADFYCQQDVSSDQKNALLSCSTDENDAELWNLEEKKKVSTFNLSENAYFMENGVSIVGNRYDDTDPIPRFFDIETGKQTKTVNGVVRFFPKDDRTIMCHFKDRKIGLYDIREKDPIKLLEKQYISNFPSCRQTISDYFPIYGNNMRIVLYSFKAGKTIDTPFKMYTMEYYRGNDMAIHNDTFVANCEDAGSEFGADIRFVNIKSETSVLLEHYAGGNYFIKSNVVYNGKKCNHMLYYGCFYRSYLETDYDFQL